MCSRIYDRFQERNIYGRVSQAALDGMDGWASGWIINGHQPGVRNLRQQGGAGVMFWAQVEGDLIIGPLKFEPGVKISSVSYRE